MKLVRAATMLAGLVLLAAPVVRAQTLDAASQTVTLNVQAVDDINVSGSFTITVASIGLQTPNTTASYDVSTNSSSARTITAEVDALPSGVILNISLADPDGGGSAVSTARNLSASPQTVVTGLANTQSGTKTITYTVTTTASTPVASTAVVVTLTLIV